MRIELIKKVKGVEVEDQMRNLIRLTLNKKELEELLELDGVQPKTKENTLTIENVNVLISKMLKNEELKHFVIAIKSGNKLENLDENEKEYIQPFIEELNNYRYLELPNERYIALVNLKEDNSKSKIIHHQISRLLNVMFELNFYFKDEVKNESSLKKAVNYATAIHNEYVKAVASKDFFKNCFNKERGASLQALTDDIGFDEIRIPVKTFHYLTKGKYKELNYKVLNTLIQNREFNVELIRHPILDHILIQKVVGFSKDGVAFIAEEVLETLLQGDTDGDQIFVYLFDKGKTTSEEDIKDFRGTNLLDPKKAEENGTTLEFNKLIESYNEHNEGKEVSHKEYEKSANKNADYNFWNFTENSYLKMLFTTLHNMIAVKTGVALTGYFAKCCDLLLNHRISGISKEIKMTQTDTRKVTKKLIRKIKEASLDIKHGTTKMEEQPWFKLTDSFVSYEIKSMIEELKSAGFEIKENKTLIQKFENKTAPFNFHL